MRISVDNLNGIGMFIEGVDAVGNAGFDLTGLGDVNDDGIDDFAIGAPFAGPNGQAGAGEVYIVFGSTDLSGGVDLDALDGSNGFVISGLNPEDNLGFSVSSAGDFDGDGFNDILIGMPGADGTGQIVVIYGDDGAAPASFDLNDLDGYNGFILTGIDMGDDAGFAIAGVGDVTNDGFDDILIGAPGANGGAGESYLIEGFARAVFNPAEPPEKKVIFEVYTGPGQEELDDKAAVMATSEQDNFVFVDKPLISDATDAYTLSKAVVADNDFDASNVFAFTQDALAAFLTEGQGWDDVPYEGPTNGLDADSLTSDDYFNLAFDYA